jgi:hypothetical protein
MNTEETREPLLIVRPIGVIRTPYKSASGTPIQPAYGQEVTGEVEIREEYQAALSDIEGFERLWLIYWLDRAGPFQPQVVPYRDTAPHGLFATRCPSRPNPIGMNVGGPTPRARGAHPAGSRTSMSSIRRRSSTSNPMFRPSMPASVRRPAGWT